jgi:hypothetical protein
MGKTNLWILSEERPKKEVIEVIIKKFMTDNSFVGFINNIIIIPILNDDKTFTFLYKILGVYSQAIENIYLKIASGYSSFVDFLLFYQNNMPSQKDTPLYGIEETKTDDSESRNTGIYQRASKFIILRYYYPNIKCIMLYNLLVEEKKNPTQTNIFGTNCLVTLGVEIIGKTNGLENFRGFNSVNEVIEFKNNMRPPPKGNVPILINQTDDRIEISGRLVKSGSLSHDPNIGALSLIAATLRLLGYSGRLVITNHGLSQNMVIAGNKFIQIAKILNIELDGLTVPEAEFHENYWKYETDGEKLGTIFIDITVENFTKGSTIFSNHAGTEKSYFLTKDGKPIPLKKYTNRNEYKAGNKKSIFYIPDLILIDFDRFEIINVEGKKYKFRKEGIEELNNYGPIEKEYINKYYPGYKIVRTVVLYGSHENKIFEIEIGFLLNADGKLILGIKPPELFKEAIKNLIDYWIRSY